MRTPWRSRRWQLIAAVALSASALALLLVQERHDRQVVRAAADGATTTTAPRPDPSHPATTTTTPRPDPSDPASYWRTDGSEPPLHPRDLLSVGFFAYGDPVENVTDVLGPPREERVEPQELVFGATSLRSWSIAPAATLLLESVPEPPHQIDLVDLTVEPGSPARIALGHDLVAGRSTLRDAMSAWGSGYWTRVTPWTPNVEDERVNAYLHEVAWSTCEGPYPVLVVFGRRVAAPPGATIYDPIPAFEPTVLDQSFTDVLIIWADADPYTSGCP